MHPDVVFLQWKANNIRRVQMALVLRCTIDFAKRSRLASAPQPPIPVDVSMMRSKLEREKSEEDSNLGERSSCDATM
ncbi:hypothetical protein PRIPAC_70662 [Pristionchus pacificus]|uniref:Uncharacterized protein n=1 Tax=Pristionchus pacificus TaxID=54126 RepID=A0A2A6C6A0_PRIPA|nr:hypothetical protein PRIPAC_70662 [Pristionchus pacificus]|eukprot:PDM73660.1 hypothetical protein PRIPAC_41016 [Pristionchus pacificus]